jgi:hypothetical protein
MRRRSPASSIEAYSALLERRAPAQLEQAVADISSIHIGDETVSAVFALRETEPLMRVSNLTSPHPATGSLLKRAQRFAKRGLLQSMVKPTAAIRYPATSGANVAIPIWSLYKKQTD